MIIFVNRILNRILNFEFNISAIRVLTFSTKNYIKAVESKIKKELYHQRTKKNRVRFVVASVSQS